MQLKERWSCHLTFISIGEITEVGIVLPQSPTAPGGKSKVNLGLAARDMREMSVQTARVSGCPIIEYFNRFSGEPAEMALTLNPCSFS